MSVVDNIDLDKLSMDERRMQATSMISAGESVLAVSEKLKVSRQTIYNWCKMEDMNIGRMKPKKDIISSKFEERLPIPTPADIKKARLNAGLTQTQAAEMTTNYGRYHTWRSYEIDKNEKGHCEINLAVWELFLLLTRQHPTMHLASGPSKD